MSRLWGWMSLALVLVAGAVFASLNAGRLVTIDLGFFTLYRVPVTFVAFGGMVVGMGVVLAAGIHADLKVRSLLERSAATDARQLRSSELGSDRSLPAREAPTGASSFATSSSPYVPVEPPAPQPREGLDDLADQEEIP